MASRGKGGRRQLIEELLQKLPQKSGVYIMRDRQGQVLYLGKARNLRARVRSYFRRGGDGRYFVRWLPELLGDIEVIITPGEKDALVLERRLVQRERPRFNVDLQDDKSFLSICLVEGEFPRLMLARRRPRVGANLPARRWFGPYTSSDSARQAFRLAQQAFGLRTCSDRAMRNRSRPCLLHGMGRCRAPCVGLIDRESYAGLVRQATDFLRGRKNEVVRALRQRMQQASDALEYELAARLRDKLRAVENALSQQPVVEAAYADVDVVGFYGEGERGAVALLKVRDGCLLGVDRLTYRGLVGPWEDCLRQLLVRHYSAGADVPPRLVFSGKNSRAAREEASALAEWLSEMRGGKVRVSSRPRGAEAALLRMAEENAADYFRRRLTDEVHRREKLEKLRRRLHLRSLPSRIECVDLSTSGGTASVGAVAVLLEGEPAPAEYRRFRIRAAAPDQDLAMMAEVVERRLRRLSDEAMPLPDLLLLDGGAAHLKAVQRVLERLSLPIELAAIAKGRGRRQKGDGGDEIYRPGRKNPVRIRPQDGELLLLALARDEAHRLASGYHRRLRSRERMGSLLEGVRGVGPVAQRRLLDAFGGLDGLRRASPRQLVEMGGVSESLAERIKEYLEKTSLTSAATPASSPEAANVSSPGGDEE